MPERTAVIVGAGLGGARAAETLRAEGFDGRILLIGDEPYRPYDRPPLSKEIMRGEWEDPAKAFLRDETFYAENGIELWLGTRATAIDTDAHTIVAAGETIRYDMLLLATGGHARTLAIPGADGDNVFRLRTLDDARAIREATREPRKVAVIGAGFIGAEVAASLRQGGSEVTLIEALPAPLVRAVGDEVGAIVADIHRSHGVALRLGAGVEAIEGGARVRLADGDAVECDVVVMGVGIVPNDDLARDAGIDCANGIVVDELCRTSAPDVYACGDVASHPNASVGERVRLEHWQNAQNQAAAAARSMLGVGQPFDEVPWFWSDQYDVNIQMFGHATRWDRIVFRGDVDALSFAAYYLDGERLAAALSVNRTKDARAVRPLIAARVPVDADVLADEGTDLRALAKSAQS